MQQGRIAITERIPYIHHMTVHENPDGYFPAYFSEVSVKYLAKE